jgi:hypothetical protein
MLAMERERRMKTRELGKIVIDFSIAMFENRNNVRKVSPRIITRHFFDISHIANGASIRNHSESLVM